jgi:hypothetical protein
VKAYVNCKGELWGDFKFLSVQWSSPIGGISAVYVMKDACEEAAKKGALYPGFRMDFLTVPLYGIRK